jgi:hypothetical protein
MAMLAKQEKGQVPALSNGLMRSAQRPPFLASLVIENRGQADSRLTEQDFLHS